VKTIQHPQARPVGQKTAFINAKADGAYSKTNAFKRLRVNVKK
jgi:hypothetical protein